MAHDYSRYFIITEWDQKLPLHLDSVGYNVHQDPITRDKGFPCFHWLHTVSGCGDFTVYDTNFSLSANQGILLKPNTPHSYVSATGTSSTSNPWSTWYLTFDGTLANSIVSALDIPYMLPIRWETDSPLAKIHDHFEEKCRFSFDFAGINGSTEVFSILALIKKFGQVSGQPSLSKGYHRLNPLLKRIEEDYGNPNVGLLWMAEILQMSPQHANSLFRKVFGISPYQYLLQFRIQKSKELLLLDRDHPVKHIAEVVGFHDSSHFVSVFHKHLGLTPMQFRQQYS